MKRILVAFLIVVALGGCGRAVSYQSPQEPTTITPSQMQQTNPTPTTTSSAPNTVSSAQISQLEQTVNGAQSILDESDQLTADQ